jgi:hypothetical protein
MGEPEDRDAAAEIERYRGQVREKVYAKLMEEKETMARQGKYPFEGRWLTLDEIWTLRRWLRRRDLGILFELILLLVFMGFMAFLFYRLLIGFLLPQ